MGFHLAYGSADEQDGLTTIRRAHELGVTLFDTAELYGWGKNEKFIGRAVKGFREDVVIATKFGLTPDYGTDSRSAHIREVNQPFAVLEQHVEVGRLREGDDASVKESLLIGTDLFEEIGTVDEVAFLDRPKMEICKHSGEPVDLVASQGGCNAAGRAS
jgi:predicted oxidoreductase